MNDIAFNRRLLSYLAAMALPLSPDLAIAKIGLAARFGDVVLEKVQIGRTYNLREASKVPFAVENRGDAPTKITVEFLIPPKGELAENYEPIPDPTWLRSVPKTIDVPAHALGYFDLIMEIPDDPALVGRHFQVTVKARSGVGAAIGLAIENKIRFSIGLGPESLVAEKKKKAMQTLDFEVTPEAIYLKSVPVGQRYDVKAQQKKAIRVANYSSQELALMLTSEAWDHRYQMPEGYEPIPDPKWIVFKSSLPIVAAEANAQVGFEIVIPDEARYRGKKYSALVRTGMAAGFWLDSPVRIFLETESIKEP